jgi:hypothetical protein
MCIGQLNLLKALVRLNAKIRGHKAYSVTVCRHTAAVRLRAASPEQGELGANVSHLGY